MKGWPAGWDIAWCIVSQNRIKLHCGDCLNVLATLPENSIDSCVTDPPYHLVSIYKRFANEARNEKTVGNHAYGRHATGFMGKQWDGGDIAFKPETWAAVYRVLKPGAHLLAFGGTRTYHRMACAIEDAGFEIRDQIQWLYGSGFPKSHNQGNGWGTALKPANEPIVLARKPLSEKTVAANVLKWGTGAINVDGCRVEAANGDEPMGWETPRGGIWKTDGAADAPLIATGKGRWPANVIHDGSEEVVGAFPESGPGPGNTHSAKENGGGIFGGGRMGIENIYKDEGSAARFFYTAKAGADDRLGSKHPTVKPLDLMQYLVRLVTPKGGTVLDLFAGTGSTGEAAFREGMNAILIEREIEYQDDIKRRINLLLAGPNEREREAIKAKTKDKPIDHGPLFNAN